MELKKDGGNMRNSFFFLFFAVFFLIMGVSFVSGDYCTSDNCDGICCIGEADCFTERGTLCCLPYDNMMVFCTNDRACPMDSLNIAWGHCGYTTLIYQFGTPSSQDFGAVLVDSCSPTKSFTLSNPDMPGRGDWVGSVSVSGPFYCDSGCDYRIPSGSSSTVKIDFCPTAYETYSRTVSFSGGEGASATVTGQGKDPDVSYTLTVSKSGTGSGTVTGSGIDCGTDCSQSYSSGTSVTLTASAASGSTFAGWSGACSGTGSCTVTMSSNKGVTATFNSAPTGPYTLAVGKSGTGSGTVTSSPAGINCGTDCSESYSSGTSVTLTASAAAGSTFAGWSGACSGTGSCVVSMSSDKSVTATFTLEPPLPTACDLTSANWSSTEVEEGALVGMNVAGTDCVDEALSFNIYRGSTSITTVYGVFPSSSWTAEPESSTPYYFIAKVVDNPSESVTSGGEDLLVTSGGVPDCDSVILCSHYETQSDCDSNVCEIDAQNSVPNVDCNDPNIECSCVWDDNECKGAWKGTTEGVCGDGVVNTGETCDGSDWGPITGCTNFDEFTGGTLSCGADCRFDTSQCVSPWGDGTEAGTCIYTEQVITNSCDDEPVGLMTFSWTAEWVWDPECDAVCQAGNQNLAAQCVDGQKTVECPAQILLPFFNVYSFIATLIIIALIYTAIILLRKKKSRVRFVFV